MKRFYHLDLLFVSILYPYEFLIIYLPHLYIFLSVLQQIYLIFLSLFLFVLYNLNLNNHLELYHTLYFPYLSIVESLNIQPSMRLSPSIHFHQIYDIPLPIFYQFYLVRYQSLDIFVPTDDLQHKISHHHHEFVLHDL